MSDVLEQQILICAPFGKDALLTAEVLGNAGLECRICKDPQEVVRELQRGAGAVLAAEEALTQQASAQLRLYIARQPAWSDLPVIVFTKAGGNSPWISGAYERFGNLTLIERPVRTSTLLSVARSALRARQRQYEVRKTDQRKDEFLAMLGHELRNPLAPIGAAAELLNLVAAQPEKVRRSGEIISRQVGHMTSLIDDLLDVARVTRGLVELAKAAVDMRDILSEALEQAAPSINARRHRLRTLLPSAPAIVQGDRKRLIQVVSNVLNNAAKYTPDCGNIELRLEVAGDEVVLAIIDDGIGMTHEMVTRVFDLFAQAERTSDRSQGGLGLGLSLVQSLVDAHGGHVHAASEGPGKGSRFTIHLPRAAGGAVAVSPVSAPGLPGQGAAAALKVMIVDDNADAARALEMLLDATGYDVSVSSTGSGALATAGSRIPRVCLLDIGLPDMDGTELAVRLRQMPGLEAAVLIAVTGYGQERDRKRTAAAGFDHHFVKPVNTARLLALMAGLS